MLDTLLYHLSHRDSSDRVFNPYKERYILNNLKAYFSYHLTHKSKVLMVGEAPGHKGCRWTGIPFTSGDIIINSQMGIFKEIGHEITLYQIEKENTAATVWEIMNTLDTQPVFWNAFQFHPHGIGAISGNRKPDALEIREGSVYLKQVYELFKPKKLCSIGRVGELILKRLFPDKEITYIRHPSYGGKEDFLKGVKQLFNCYGS